MRDPSSPAAQPRRENVRGAAHMAARAQALRNAKQAD